MGTIDQILDDIDSITWDLALLDVDDREAWLDIIHRIDKNRVEFKTWIETPAVIHNLQDKPQPKR